MAVDIFIALMQFSCDWVSESVSMSVSNNASLLELRKACLLPADLILLSAASHELSFTDRPCEAPLDARAVLTMGVWFGPAPFATRIQPAASGRPVGPARSDSQGHRQPS